MENQVIGIAVLAVVLPAIIEIIKHFTKKPDFTKDDRDMLKELHKMHSIFDSEGRPVWYNSVNQYEHNNRQTELMRDIVYTQKEIITALMNMKEKVGQQQYLP